MEQFALHCLLRGVCNASPAGAAALCARCAFRPRLFTQLVEGYWEVFALMSLGFFLHFVPDSWEHACCKAVIRLPLIGKALLLVAMVYLVIQMKSSEIQPFIYFQF